MFQNGPWFDTVAPKQGPDVNSTPLFILVFSFEVTVEQTKGDFKTVFLIKWWALSSLHKYLKATFIEFHLVYEVDSLSACFNVFM